jgi:hypothetical protein
MIVYNWQTALGRRATDKLVEDPPRFSTTPIGLEGLTRRQDTWQRRAAQIGAYPLEFLLPRINVAYRDEWPAGMIDRADAARTAHPDLFRQLTDHQWGYYYYLGRGASTKDKEVDAVPARALSLLRFQMINDTVADILGDEIQGSTLIDFASNWGGMAIDMAARGMQAWGFDIRTENVVKAQTLARYLDVDTVSFEQCDVYDAITTFGRRFDVVYNLGLLYHVTDPFALMKVTFDMCERMAVIDTIATREPFSGFKNNAVPGSLMAAHAKGMKTLELRPTYRAVIDLMHAAGFVDLIEIIPTLGTTFPQCHARSAFEQCHRRVIIGFKLTDTE